MRYFPVVMALMLAFAASALAVDLSGLNRLDGVSVYSDDKEARVVIRFAGDVGEKPRPVFYEKSIQLDMDGVYVNPPQRDFDLGDPFLPKAAAYQLTPEKTRLRLFLADDPREYEARTESSVNGELLILAIRKKEAAATPRARAKSEPVEPLPDIEELEGVAKTLAATAAMKNGAAKTTADVDSAETSGAGGSGGRLERLAARVAGPGKTEKLEEPGKSNASSGAKGFLEYRDPEAPRPPSLGGMAVKMAASLSLTLAVIFALAWAAKKYSGRLGGTLGHGGVVKVLAAGAIDMKRRVVVADIAGEVMIIGLSGDSMTMLGVIDDEEKADLLRRKNGTNHSAGSRPFKGPEPSGLGRALRFFRIGKMEAAANPRALFDESDGETFAGALSRAAGGGAAAPSREELLKNVAGAIRARNKRLGYA